MSERIITLREQAEKFATDSVPYFRGEIGGVWEQEFNRVCDEKFAELILKECLKINEVNIGLFHHELLTQKYKEHFGVE